jgi:hypothetical protein
MVKTLKLENHDALTASLISRTDGTPIEKLEVYVIFQTPVAVKWHNPVEKCDEHAEPGDWVSVGQQGQMQRLVLAGKSTAHELYDLGHPMTYKEACMLMFNLVGIESVGPLVVMPAMVKGALKTLAKANENFKPGDVKPMWYRAARKCFIWQVEIPVAIRKVDWGTDGWSEAGTETAVVMLSNGGKETYALQKGADLPGWCLSGDTSVRGNDLFNLATVLPEDFLQQFAS